MNSIQTTASAVDTAEYIRKQLGNIGALKLQKLTYYVQGWNLAWFGLPFYNSEIEAWKNGPVVRDVYRENTYHRDSQGEMLAANVDRLADSQREVIDKVLSHYRDFSGQELVEMTHKESPWLDARGDLADGDHSTEEMTVSSIRRFFTRKAVLGEGIPAPKIELTVPSKNANISEVGSEQADKWRQTLNWLSDK